MIKPYSFQSKNISFSDPAEEAMVNVLVEEAIFEAFENGTSTIRFHGFLIVVYRKNYSLQINISQAETITQSVYGAYRLA